jgi:hypothetical protein
VSPYIAKFLIRTTGFVISFALIGVGSPLRNIDLAQKVVGADEPTKKLPVG